MNQQKEEKKFEDVKEDDKERDNTQGRNTCSERENRRRKNTFFFISSNAHSLSSSLHIHHSTSFYLSFFLTIFFPLSRFYLSICHSFSTLSICLSVYLCTCISLYLSLPVCMSMFLVCAHLPLITISMENKHTHKLIKKTHGIKR